MGNPVQIMTIALFVFSGATSLVYQVTWMRVLSLFFGSDVYAAAITVSVFMGGLSLGSWIVGRIGDNLRHPFAAYGFCEIGIAFLALAFPYLLNGFEDTYREIYRAHFETRPALYHGFRLLVVAAAILPPTILMGATLPLIVRQFAGQPDVLGLRVGTFYAVNTMGALIGTIGAGFILIPMLGVAVTTYTAIIANFIIGIVAFGLAFAVTPPDAGGSSLSPEPGIRSTKGDQNWRIIVVIALSGIAALALEVVWMRVLVQSFGATVHAFAIMLASFLFGIFYGSARAGHKVDKISDPTRLLFRIEVWLAVAVAALALVTYVIPGLFGNLLWILTAATGGEFATVSTLMQFGVAFLLIVGPTSLLGATIPVAIKAYSDDIEKRARDTGLIYAANTAGAVAGALIAGFVLLPNLGVRASLIAISLVFLTSALLLPRQGAAWRQPRFLGMVAFIPVSALVLFLLPRQTVVNYNMQRTTTPEILYHGEGGAHTVDIVRSGQGHTIMMVNGNIEADTTFIQRRHFLLKGHLPLLLHAEPSDVAIIGLGLGITLAAIARHPTVSNIQLVELSPEMVRAHRLNPDITGDVLSDPKVRLRIDDGRNFMTMSSKKFDMITADPIHPRITGVGYLYTSEYYNVLKERLRAGGIVTQWMPLYSVSKRSFDVALRTFFSVMPNASFWYVRGHGLLISTADEFRVDYANLADRFNHPAVRDDMGSIGIKRPEELLGHLLMDSEHIRKYLSESGDSLMNTDDNAYLEYHTPFEFLEKTESIVEALLPHAGWNIEKILVNAGPGVRDRVSAARSQRRARILPELSEPIH